MVESSSPETTSGSQPLPLVPTRTRIYRDDGNGVISGTAARDLHKWLMSRLPRLGETGRKGNSPRARAQLQWQRAGNILAVRTRGDITLETVSSDRVALLHEREDTVPALGTVLTIDIARQYTPRVEVDSAARALLESLGVGHEADKTRAKPVPVPDDRLERWASDLLSRHLGDAVELLSATRCPDVILSHRFPNRERVPAAQITARVTHACSPGNQGHELLAKCIATGLGRARNYGLGMILIPSAQA